MSQLPQEFFPHNAILAALPAGEYSRLAQYLTKVTLEQGQVLNEVEQPPQDVYFLTEGIAIVVIFGAGGKQLEMSVIGNESIVGERAVFEGGLSMIRCSMMTSGTAYKLSSLILYDEFYAGGKLHDLVMRTIEARLVETSQNALCNRAHRLEQRLSRWLLLMTDRLHCDTLPLTHEKLADFLGVQRAALTVAAGNLRKAGLIELARGAFMIVDHLGLESHCCECYESTQEAVRTAYCKSWYKEALRGGGERCYITMND
jgi:CRP-like cAMP-binding protein